MLGLALIILVGSLELVVNKITLRFPRMRSIRRFKTRTPGVRFRREFNLFAKPCKISVISLSNTCKKACKMRQYVISLNLKYKFLC